MAGFAPFIPSKLLNKAWTLLYSMLLVFLNCASNNFKSLTELWTVSIKLFEVWVWSLFCFNNFNCLFKSFICVFKNLGIVSDLTVPLAGNLTNTFFINSASCPITL